MGSSRVGGGEDYKKDTNFVDPSRIKVRRKPNPRLVHEWCSSLSLPLSVSLTFLDWFFYYQTTNVRDSRSLGHHGDLNGVWVIKFKSSTQNSQIFFCARITFTISQHPPLGRALREEEEEANGNSISYDVLVIYRTNSSLNPGWLCC